MTESLLCIGGPFDGQRHESTVDGSQTLVKYVRLKVEWDGRFDPLPQTQSTERAIYTRQTIYLGSREDRADFWLHESLSLRAGFERLLDRYTGDSE